MSRMSKFGRKTPPAIFSMILGLFGLSLSWRAASNISVLPSAVAELVLGAATALFLVAALAYCVKVLRRPGALMEDLRILPGRGGLAASAVCVSALAAGFVPIRPEVAQSLLNIALFLHVVMAVLVAVTLLTGPAEQRQVTPIWHLSFVGFIVAAVSAVSLQHYVLAEAIFWATLFAAVLIWGVSALQLMRRSPPAPLRPMLAIHLAPASLFGIVALGFPAADFPVMALMAQAMAFVALLIFAMLLMSLRWIIEAGFTPLWASFTFPLCAFATFYLSFAGQTGMSAALLVGGVALALASGAVPWIAAKVIKLWMSGQLSTKTNAAEA